MNKNILVLLPINEKQKDFLNQRAKGADLIYSSPECVTEEQVRISNIIIGNPPPEMLKCSENLELLQLQSAGADAYIEEGILPKGAALTNATGAYGLAISEHMLAGLLAIYKKLYYYKEKQNEKQWSDGGPVKTIYGSTALVIGLGDIGGDFAARIKALGGYTIGVKRVGVNKPDYLDELCHMDKLDEMIPRADIIALSLPGTPETYHIINDKRIELMKKDAVLINIGRGTAIDTDALCNTMENGKLLGAFLDVTDPEPLPKCHRLWDIQNVLITPHISGGNHSEHTLDRIIDISTQNMQAILEGGTLINTVDLKTGYRKLNTNKKA